MAPSITGAAVLTLALAACGASTSPGTSTLPGASTTPGAPPSTGFIQPVATIRLSASAASSVALANGWLWVTHHPSTVVSQVDPRTDREVSTVEVGLNGASVTEIGGRPWIGHYTNRPEDARLTILDPLTPGVVLTAALPNLCCELAGSAGKGWAIDPRGALIAIDPVSGAVVGTTPVTLASNVHAGLMADEDGIWLSSDPTPLLEVDPRSGAVVASIDVGGGIPMTIAQGLVWGAGPTHVWAVDSRTGTVRASFPMEQTIETLALAVSEDSIWAGVRRPGHVGRLLRLDIHTGQLRGEAQVSLPARVLYAEGDVFVVDSDTNTLLRFRP